nr:YbjN domain-containing protein [Actinomycetales bacterium]
MAGVRKVPAAQEHAAPVTPARIAKALAARGYVTQTMGGVVSGAWDGFDVTIRLEHVDSLPGGPDDGLEDSAQPSFMVLEARWGIAIPQDMRSALHLALNDWNREQLWPTGVLTPRGEGWTALARYAADTADGLSDGQLLATLDIALRGSISLLKNLGKPERRLEDG